MVIIMLTTGPSSPVRKKSAMQEQLPDIATYNGHTQDSCAAAIAAAIMCDDMWIEYFSDIFESGREFACIASQVVIRLIRCCSGA